MKNGRVIIAVLVMLLTSLACQALVGDDDASQEATIAPVATVEVETLEPTEAINDLDSTPNDDLEFPVPDDAQNLVIVEGTVNYQTAMRLEDVMKFYRDEFSAQGYVERELLTTVAAGVFSMVFDGHESGQSIVIQGVDLGNGSTNISIRLETVD